MPKVSVTPQLTYARINKNKEGICLEVYLDHSATTPVDPEVVEAMAPYWSLHFGNPSSPHRLGVEAESVLTQCRRFIAQTMQVNPNEIVFTSGGTESNNLAILGYARAQYKPGRIITTSIEHPSVLNPISYLRANLGWQATKLPVNSHGKIDPADLAGAISPDTSLVSIMLVNNEIGSIQDLAAISEIIAAANRKRRQKIVFHVDACQAFGTVPIDLAGLQIDLLSISSHKIFGPKGIGLLYVKTGIHLQPLLFGGGQEGGLRSGTENLPAIVGLAKAVQLAMTGFPHRAPALAELRSRLVTRLMQIPGTFCNSPPDGAPHIVSIRYEGVKAEVLVHFLEQKGVYLSMGAACSSRKNKASHVLQAIGLSPDQASSTVRIGLSPKLSPEQIDYACDIIEASVREVRDIYG
ncbi:MAG: cysteine desulfurase [Firmicutes bacterium]|jgi:cysteine desulfurase|nr:cysteine desulfurase [Bacillota bacterium]